MNRLLLIVFLSVLLSGCGTFLARENVVSADAKVYPATRLDIEGFYLGVTGNTIMHQHYDLPGDIVASTLVPICMLIDLPFSLVTDTILLPVDIYAEPKDESYNQSLKRDEETAGVPE